MNKAVRSAFNKSDQSGRGIARVGGRHSHVIHDFQRFAGLWLLQNGFDKVAAFAARSGFAKKTCGSNDEPARRLPDEKFSRQLACPVHIDGASWVRFHVRARLFAIEDVIGADMNTQRIDLRARARDVERADSVHFECLARALLAVIDAHVRSAVNCNVRP